MFGSIRSPELDLLGDNNDLSVFMLGSLKNERQQNQRWESGFKVEIPEFHGGVCGDTLLDWMVSVEEILDFTQVPEDRRVPLVAMWFRGHAASWWRQIKMT